MLRNIHECIRAIDIYSGVVMSLRLNADDRVERLTASIMISDRYDNRFLILPDEIRTFTQTIREFVHGIIPGFNPNAPKLQYVVVENLKEKRVNISFKGTTIKVGGDRDPRINLTEILETISLWHPFILQWESTGIIDHSALDPLNRMLLLHRDSGNFLKVLARQGNMSNPLTTITVRDSQGSHKELVISNRTQFSMIISGTTGKDILELIIETLQSKPMLGNRKGHIKELAGKYVFVCSLIKAPRKENFDRHQLTIMSEVGPYPQAIRLNFETDEERNEIISGLEHALTIV
ncbi:hypothetical protein [Klebsiella phage YC1]|nr:hypothetical protein [Klebsiella phage YC1]